MLRGLKMKAKILGILAVFLFALLSLNTADAASSYYDISKVEVENKEVSTTDTSYIVVERGQDIQIDVWINGKTTAPATSIDNVRVKAWIEGYRTDIYKETERFAVIAGKKYSKYLSLKMAPLHPTILQICLLLLSHQLKRKFL